MVVAVHGMFTKKTQASSHFASVILSSVVTSMTLPHTLFASLLLLVLEWRDDGNGDDRAEHLEACRECMRSILTVLGVSQAYRDLC